jgi:hypothetical protein
MFLMCACFGPLLSPLGLRGFKVHRLLCELALFRVLSNLLQYGHEIGRSDTSWFRRSCFAVSDMGPPSPCNAKTRLRCPCGAKTRLPRGVVCISFRLTVVQRIAPGGVFRKPLLIRIHIMVRPIMVRGVLGDLSHGSGQAQGSETPLNVNSAYM